MNHNTWLTNFTSHQWIEQLDTTNQIPNYYKYHSIRKRHKETEDLASHDPVARTNYQTTSRKQRT